MNIFNYVLSSLTGFYIIKEADLYKSLTEDHPLDTLLTFCPSVIDKATDLAKKEGFIDNE